ncbi:MAG: hypothetical protein Q9202_000416 [Teloschistes flavicans]
MLILPQKGHDSANGIPNGDSPEATIARGVVSNPYTVFGSRADTDGFIAAILRIWWTEQSEEVLHLPVIVEAAESSPAAAEEAATRIRKFLARDNYQRAYVQYNAIMLMRILTDNPGKTFTKNLDGKFTSAVKELLRDGRDMSVQQILRETLDSFETAKADDETLAPLRNMWKREKTKWSEKGTQVRVTAINPGIRPREPSNGEIWQFYWQQQQQQQQMRYANAASTHTNSDQNYFARNHRPRGLPPPHELAQRIEEARTSSNLLLQVVQSTPPNEVLTNELIKEFVERCQSASRSIQGYINSENPPPDENTLLTLIETNDRLSVAMSRYQRAMLQARRMTGSSPSPAPPPAGGAQEMPVHTPADGPYNPPSGPPPRSNTTTSIFGNPSSPPPSHRQNRFADQPGYSNGVHHDQQPDGGNPFDDPAHAPPPAPADYGLPPANSRFSNETGYVNAKNVEMGRSAQPYGRTQTHMDHSDEDDDQHGHTRGQPVQYRF